jgi:hypothetical protein
MISVCASLAIARLVQAETTIPVMNRRPSTLMNEIQPQGLRGMFPDATITVDDVKSRFVVAGSADDVRDIQKVVQLLDSPRRRVQVEIGVNSPIDHMHYKLNAEIYSKQGWSTEDKELDFKLQVTPRLNDDGSSTFQVLCGHRGKESVLVFRLKSGSSAGIPCGRATKLKVDGTLLKDDPGPELTLKFLGTKGD